MIATLRHARRLGTLALLPFLALALLTWTPDAAAIRGFAAARLAQLALAAYAAMFLSFLGALHWGVTIAIPETPAVTTRRALNWGVIPPLLGWLALLMTFVGMAPGIVFAVLVADFLLVWWMDAALLRLRECPAGYVELRSRLMAGATLALAIALAATV